MVFDSLRPSYLLLKTQLLFRWFMILFFLTIGIGLYLALGWSPADYQQGETVRIMYVHVPCSWGALALYTFMAIFSAIALIKKMPLFHLMAQACAPVGITLGVISLLTGSIWGYPTWGTWWVWDARLTSMLLLVFLYAGFIFLGSGFHNQHQKQKAAAFLALLGWINVPIIKWSVEWWTTLHQPASIMRFAKPAVHWTMLLPLGVMGLALAFLSLALICLIFRTILLEYHYRALCLRENFKEKL